MCQLSLEMFEEIEVVAIIAASDFYSTDFLYGDKLRLTHTKSTTLVDFKLNEAVLHHDDLILIESQR